MNVFQVPVAFSAAVPPITSGVSAVISNILEFTATPVTVVPSTPAPSPILSALEPQLLKVFPETVTDETVVSVESTTAPIADGKSVRKAT